MLWLVIIIVTTQIVTNWSAVTAGRAATAPEKLYKYQSYKLWMCVRLCEDGGPPRYAGRDRWSALPSCGDIVAHMQHTLANTKI